MPTKEPKGAPHQQEDLAVIERRQVKQPQRYVVVLHNDDYTTMEFVVHVLVKFFHKGETEATQIMLHVHHKGYGVVGHFARDVAATARLGAAAVGGCCGTDPRFIAALRAALADTGGGTR